MLFISDHGLLSLNQHRTTFLKRVYALFQETKIVTKNKCLIKKYYLSTFRLNVDRLTENFRQTCVKRRCLTEPREQPRVQVMQVSQPEWAWHTPALQQAQTL